MTSTLPPGDGTRTPFDEPGPGAQPGVPVRRGSLPGKLPVFRKLVASLQQVYLALYAAEVGVWEWNVEENIITWSLCVDRIFGLSTKRSTFSSAELFRQVWPEDLARVKASLEQVLKEGATGKTFEFQCRIYRPNGTLRWIEVAGSIGQSVALTVLGTVRDVTERHGVDEEARFYRALLECQNEASPDGILVVASNQRILYHNRRFVEIWGMPAPVLASRDAQAAMNWAKQAVVDPDTAVFRTDDFSDATGQSKHDELNLRDGRIIERYSAPVMMDDNACLGRVWYFRDITGKRRMESRLLHTQRLESIGSVASGIAHELKNILTPIILHTQLLQEDLGPAHAAQPGLRQVMKSCQRASGLIQQILTVSRRQESRRELVNLRDVVAEAVKLLSATIPASVALKVKLANELPVVLADATQVQQVVLNLGINAWHASDTGAGEIEIVLDEVTLGSEAATISPELAPGPYARLSVRDNGKGMDETTLARIFEPFFTTKPEGKGTGLGLSVVQGIVENHQGAITVESKPGQGAVFQIYFPAPAPVSPSGFRRDQKYSWHAY